MKNSTFLSGLAALLGSLSVAPAADAMIGNIDQYSNNGLDLRSPSPGFAFGTAFRTGPEWYRVDAVTLEHFLAPPGAESKFQVRLLQVGLYGFIDLGTFETHVVRPEPTPFPGLTVYVAYLPAAGSELILEPSTEYLLAVGQPLDGLPDTTVVFAGMTGFAGNVAWEVGHDYSGQFLGGTEYWGIGSQPGHLKFQLDATPIEPPNLPPDVSQAFPSVTTLWPPNGSIVPVEIRGVTDPDGDSIAIAITQIEQDEPLRPTGAGTRRTSFALEGMAALQARRDGQRNGRVYHVSFTATDSKGAVSEGQVYVTVPHDQDGEPAIDDGPISGYYRVW